MKPNYNHNLQKLFPESNLKTIAYQQTPSLKDYSCSCTDILNSAKTAISSYFYLQELLEVVASFSNPSILITAALHLPSVASSSDITSLTDR